MRNASPAFVRNLERARVVEELRWRSRKVKWKERGREYFRKRFENAPPFRISFRNIVAPFLVAQKGALFFFLIN